MSYWLSQQISMTTLCKTWWRFLWLSLWLILTNAPGIAQSTVNRIDSLMKAKHQAGEFNGTVLVALDGAVVYRHAFGYAEAGRTLEANTQFYLGSVSKAFTGMAIMMLVEENKIAYDDPVGKYFPQLQDFTGTITIRNLLNHTSGLPDYYNMGKYQDGMTNDMVFSIIMELDSLAFPPGQRYAYSNTAYVLLSLLIEQVSKQSFRDFVSTRIFRPTGMNSSEVVDGTQPAMPARAQGHRQNGESDDYRAFTTGAGGIYSQVDDLFLWDQALYTEQLVKKETLSQAFAPARLNDGTSSYYGFGWVLDQRHPGVVQHSGSLAGFRTYFYRDTENHNTIILLSNYTNDVSSLKEALTGLLQY